MEIIALIKIIVILIICGIVATCVKILIRSMLGQQIDYICGHKWMIVIVNKLKARNKKQNGN